MVIPGLVDYGVHKLIMGFVDYGVGWSFDDDGMDDDDDDAADDDMGDNNITRLIEEAPRDGGMEDRVIKLNQIGAWHTKRLINIQVTFQALL